MIRRALAAVLVGLSVAACSAHAGAHEELTVFAAASLRDVVADAAEAYAETAPGVTLAISTDSSAALRTRIEHGAPADVFLSADTTNPQRLADAGLTDGPPIPFAGNVLSIIVPASDPAGIGGPFDLANPGVKVVAAAADVPISAYARQVVENLAGADGAPAAFAAAYEANIVSREDNVAGVVAKIELGEADAGIVYVTDALAATGVRRVDIPDAANVTAVYAGVVVAASADRDSARSFLAWLIEPAGQAVLAESGFLPPP